MTAGHRRMAGRAGGPMPEPMVVMGREHYAPYRWVQSVVAALAL